MDESTLNEIERARRDIVLSLKASGIDPFGKRFESQLANKELKENFDSLEGKEVSGKGRITAIRGHGKATFATVRDFSGDLQYYFRLDNLGEEKYNFFKKVIDIGDFIGAKGKLFKTHTGEITLEVNDFVLLTKSIRILPEKWHGLRDAELRYRKRYLDLVANRDVIEIFLKRSEIIDKIRNFLQEKGFVEVETPMLQPVAGGATAKPFKTYYHALNQEMYLRIAPELYLKRLIVGGFEKVFEINRNFRNEGISTKHNPEFTMLEAYWAYTDYNDIMKLTEELINYVVRTINGDETLQYNGEEIDFKIPFRRIEFNDALREYAGISMEEIRNTPDLQKLVNNMEIKMDKSITIGNIINEIFDKKVEKNLVQPTFVYDFPIEISPLAKRKESNPYIVERFELFIGGLEIANAFSELNDPLDQYERFKAQIEQKNMGDEEIHEIDMDYIEAMEYGLPPTGGLGIGIDRLVMILTGQDSIREVILFPQLKKKEKDEEEK